LVAHGDEGREVRVARGGGGELEGPGAEVEGKEEEEQVRVVVDMGGVRVLSDGDDGSAPSGGERGLDGREGSVARWWEAGLESDVDATGQSIDEIV
jgi:hypothetical protein